MNRRERSSRSDVHIRVELGGCGSARMLGRSTSRPVRPVMKAKTKHTPSFQSLCQSGWRLCPVATATTPTRAVPAVDEPGVVGEVWWLNQLRQGADVSSITGSAASGAYARMQALLHPTPSSDTPSRPCGTESSNQRVPT